MKLFSAITIAQSIALCNYRSHSSCLRCFNARTFRNPIVEPGLVGTSAGAAFGASFVFVMAAKMSPEVKSLAGPLLVPLFAFAGGLLATFMVYSLAKNAKEFL